MINSLLSKVSTHTVLGSYSQYCAEYNAQLNIDWCAKCYMIHGTLMEDPFVVLGWIPTWRPWCTARGCRRAGRGSGTLWCGSTNTPVWRPRRADSCTPWPALNRHGSSAGTVYWYRNYLLRVSVVSVVLYTSPFLRKVILQTLLPSRYNIFI